MAGRWKKPTSGLKDGNQDTTAEKITLEDKKVQSDPTVWVCASCLSDLPVPRPTACPRCGSTAANPK